VTDLFDFDDETMFGDAGAPATDDLQAMDPGLVIREQCSGWLAVTEQYRLRVHKAWPGPDAIPDRIKDTLVSVRGVLDNVETIYGQVMAVRNATAMRARAAELAAEDAWDRQAEAEQHSHRQRPDYQGSRERYAYWNIAIRAERQAAREARELADYVRGVYDQVKLAYDGINETRRDLAARLTHLRWERSIES
jgi:hypothetical protein